MASSGRYLILLDLCPLALFASPPSPTSSKDINTRKSRYRLYTIQIEKSAVAVCRSQRSFCQPVSSGFFAPSASSLTALKQHVTHVRTNHCTKTQTPCLALPYPTLPHYQALQPIWPSRGLLHVTTQRALRYYAHFPRRDSSVAGESG